MKTGAKMMGRPRASAEGARGAVYTLRLLPTERTAIEEAAKLAKMHTSEWVRLALVAAAQAEQERAMRSAQETSAAAPVEALMS